MCCRLNNLDYFDSDEEQIQIDYNNESGNTESQPTNNNLPPSPPVPPPTTQTIPLFLILTEQEIKSENIRKLRKVKRKIELKDIPRMFQSIKSPTPEKESSDIRQHQHSLSCQQIHPFI